MGMWGPESKGMLSEASSIRLLFLIDVLRVLHLHTLLTYRSALTDMHMTLLFCTR